MVQIIHSNINMILISETNNNFLFSISQSEIEGCTIKNAKQKCKKIEKYTFLQKKTHTFHTAEYVSLCLCEIKEFCKGMNVK